MKSSRFLDVQGVSEYTTLSKSTIYKRVVNCTIPYTKIGKKVVFDIQQIDAWMNNGGQMVDDIPNFNHFLN